MLEVTTDGSIHPKDALKEAAKILIYHFMLFSDEKITLENPDQDTNQEFDEEVLHMRQLLKTKLTDLNLSVSSGSSQIINSVSESFLSNRRFSPAKAGLRPSPISSEIGT